MNRGAWCPYCGAPVEITHDDGYGLQEDTLYEDECMECEKEFEYWISYGNREGEFNLIKLWECDYENK